MWKKKTWDDVCKDNSISLIEHPIYPCDLEKMEFYKEFQPVLDEMNGETLTDYMSFFFTRGIVNEGILKFDDEDAKEDFYDWAVEKGCLLSLKETHQGESNNEVENRRERLERTASNERAQKIQRKKKLVLTPQEMDKRRLLGIEKSLSKIKDGSDSPKYSQVALYFQEECSKYESRYDSTYTLENKKME